MRVQLTEAGRSNVGFSIPAAVLIPVVALIILWLTLAAWAMTSRGFTALLVVLVAAVTIGWTELVGL